MKKSFFALSFILAALVTSVSAQTVAFTNVSVIPMDRERVLVKQTVVVKNGLIAEIGDAKKVKLPKDAVRVDGTGKYLVPGLVDMHTHLLSDSNEFPDSIGPDELRVMVANGVTTDGDLIVRIADGDRGAFEELYRRYARPVLGLALLILAPIAASTRGSSAARCDSSSSPRSSAALAWRSARRSERVARWPALRSAGPAGWRWEHGSCVAGVSPVVT